MSNIFETAATISAVDAFQRYVGGDLRRTGRNIKCRCPWHNDKTPSLTFFPDGKFKCFGCNKTGDAIDVVRFTYGISPSAAALRICTDFGLKFGISDIPVKAQIAKRSKRDRKDELTEIYQELCEAIRAMDKAIDSMEAEEQAADDFSETFKRAVEERNKMNRLVDQLLEMLANDDIDAGVVLMESCRNERAKWKGLIRFWNRKEAKK